MEEISFDFNNMMSNRIGKRNGVSEAEIEEIKPQIGNAFRLMAERRYAFMELPYNKALADKINNMAGKMSKEFKHLVIVGIGGSALGSRMLHSALSPYQNICRVSVIDNVDPDTMYRLIKNLDFRHTLFNIVTKSGNTVETVSNFLILRKRLIDAVGPQEYKRHIIVTTDPEKGSLRGIAGEEGYLSLEIPSDVGGRFSVLSSVGLFSAGFAGIDISALLDGARSMDKLCRADDIWRNPAAMSAVLQYILYKKGRRISVFMPYAGRLRNLSEWFGQLWAESLGKSDNVGPTPVKALGVTDQHSQLQLYMQGPGDKIITFIKVNKFENDIAIPDAFKQYDKVSSLSGHTLQELILAEQKGTELSLAGNSRPSCTIALNKISPFTIGGLIYLCEMQTAFIGELFGVDAFNQPGVEQSKDIASALLGRPGYEKIKNDIEKLPAGMDKYVM